MRATLKTWFERSAWNLSLVVVQESSKTMEAAIKLLEHALAELGLEPGLASSALALEGTGNRSVLIRTDGESLVVRMDGVGIDGLVDREREHIHARLAAERGLGPDLVFCDAAKGLLVTRFVEGRRFDALERPFGQGVIERLVQTLARLRDVQGFGDVMNPWEKIAGYLDQAGYSDPGHDDALGAVWPGLVDLRANAEFEAADLVPSHIDPVPENLLDLGDRVVMLDWEYSALSHPLWDLAYFATEAGLSRDERAILLATSGVACERRRFGLWMMLAMAVSLAWCLLRLTHETDDKVLWTKEVARRRHLLARSLSEVSD